MKFHFPGLIDLPVCLNGYRDLIFLASFSSTSRVVPGSSTGGPSDWTRTVSYISQILFSLFSLFLSIALSSPSLCACVACCVDRAIVVHAVQQLRAAVHQFHQWEAATILQPLHVRARAGGVRTRGYRVDLHRFRFGLAADNQSDWEGKATIRSGHGLDLDPADLI